MYRKNYYRKPYYRKSYNSGYSGGYRKRSSYKRSGFSMQGILLPLGLGALVTQLDMEAHLKGLILAGLGLAINNPTLKSVGAFMVGTNAKPLLEKWSKGSGSASVASNVNAIEQAKNIIAQKAMSGAVEEAEELLGYMAGIDSSRYGSFEGTGNFEV